MTRVVLNFKQSVIENDRKLTQATPLLIETLDTKNKQDCLYQGEALKVPTAF